MSEDIRKMIDKVKNLKQFVNENKMNNQMIIAYQGSNANHDGFDIKKIGSGEGNVAFGFGFYFTSCYEIAKFYEDNLWIRKAFKYDFLREFVKWVVDGKFNPYKKDVYRNIVIDYNTNIGDIIKTYEMKGDYGKEISEFLKNKLIDEKIPKIVYTVSLNLKNPIYWHKKNNNHIIEILKKHNIDLDINNGEQIYKEIAKIKGGFKNASEFLNSIGINSIIYDAGTKSGVEKSSCTNYVLFNDEDVKIINKNVK